jgi:hypothetical protein
MKVLRMVAVALAMLLGAGLCGWRFAVIQSAQADAKPAVRLNVSNAVPRQVDETVQQAIVRDYTSAWQAMEAALSKNDAAALGDNFIGFAFDKITQRIQDQKSSGLKTRIVDRGHSLDAIFYSPDGSAMELKDTAILDTEILDGGTVIHSDRSHVEYFVIMTGAEDRWKVRVLQSAGQN